jgi:hypothetical protein
MSDRVRLRSWSVTLDRAVVLEDLEDDESA